LFRGAAKNIAAVFNRENQLEMCPICVVSINEKDTNDVSNLIMGTN